MSSNSNTEREGGASASLGLAQAQVPRLAPGGYAAWRPVMENVLMRAGIVARDYKVENKDWAALVEAVDRWAIEDESASIAHALGRTSTSASSSSSSTKSSTAGPSAAEKESRRGAVEVVVRTKKAYGLLFTALTEDLRRLAAHVSQGDAYGLWSWLEKRFQNTEQDNIGDLWDQFTGMSQESEETFDEFKARVDQVYGLLAHAKDKPSAGLYAHRVLWKLSHRYSVAVLALKASGKLKDADKIDWDEIAAFINNHERSELRLNGDDADGTIMAIAKRRGNLANMECYNCGHKGHMARDCKKPHRAHAEEASSSSGSGDDSDNEREDKRGSRHVSWKKGVKEARQDKKARKAERVMSAIMKKEGLDPKDDFWYVEPLREYRRVNLDSKMTAPRGERQGRASRA